MRIATAGAILIAVLTQESARPSSPQPGAAPRAWTTAEDHQQMMAQLGITRLRPGPSGTEQAPNAANYDEVRANPYPNLPDVLTLANGQKVATADAWRTQRRPEIVEAFEREVYGRVPRAVPKVTWTVTRSVEQQVAGRPVIGRRVIGRVDNSAHPAIDVEIQLVLVTPAT